MSWKSIVCTGLLCVVASPVLADPTISVVPGGTFANGHLNEAGQWVWRVEITPDASLFDNNGPNGTPPNTVGGSTAVEIGFTASGNATLVSATKDATNFPNNNVGDSPFAFGDGVEGISTGGNSAFAALGSDYFTTGTSKTVLNIVTSRPITAGNSQVSSTILQWLGAYGGAGRVAQNDTNFDNALGGLQRRASSGDADLDGQLTPADFNAWLLSAGTNWYQGDFDGDGTPTPADFNQWLLSANPVSVGPNPFPGAGGAAIEIPEPASLVTLVAGALFAGLFGCRRS